MVIIVTITLIIALGVLSDTVRLPFHTLSSLRARAGLAPPFPWHPSNFHKVQKSVQVVVMILMDYYDLLPCPALSLAPF